MFKQLISTLQLIHDRCYCHRDLKCENLLLDSNFNLRVSDFGLSTDTEGQDHDGFRSTKVGTEGYRSPEMQTTAKYNGIQSDLFAAGVILFMMYTGSPPFLSTRPSDKIYRMIREGNFKRFWTLHSKRRSEHNQFPPEFQKLMNSFFSYDPHNRPTLQSLKIDPWLNSASSNTIPFEQELSMKLNSILQIDQRKQMVHQTVKMLKGSLRKKKLSEQSTMEITITTDTNKAVDHRKQAEDTSQKQITKQQKINSDCVSPQIIRYLSAPANDYLHKVTKRLLNPNAQKVRQSRSMTLTQQVCKYGQI